MYPGTRPRPLHLTKEQLAVQILVRDYLCPVCNEIIYHAVRTNCGHIFCRYCLLKWVHKGNTSCPLCMEPYGSYNLLSNIDAYIDNEFASMSGRLQAERQRLIGSRYFPERQLCILELERQAQPWCHTEAAREMNLKRCGSVRKQIVGAVDSELGFRNRDGASTSDFSGKPAAYEQPEDNAQVPDFDQLRDEITDIFQQVEELNRRKSKAARAPEDYSIVKAEIRDIVGKTELQRQRAKSMSEMKAPGPVEEPVLRKPQYDHHVMGYVVNRNTSYPTLSTISSSTSYEVPESEPVKKAKSCTNVPTEPKTVITQEMMDSHESRLLLQVERFKSETEDFIELLRKAGKSFKTGKSESAVRGNKGVTTKLDSKELIKKQKKLESALVSLEQPRKAPGPDKKKGDPKKKKARHPALISKSTTLTLRKPVGRRRRIELKKIKSAIQNNFGSGSTSLEVLSSNSPTDLRSLAMEMRPAEKKPTIELHRNEYNMNIPGDSKSIPRVFTSWPNNPSEVQVQCMTKVQGQGSWFPGTRPAEPRQLQPNDVVFDSLEETLLNQEKSAQAYQYGRNRIPGQFGEVNPRLLYKNANHPQSTNFRPSQRNNYMPSESNNTNHQQQQRNSYLMPQSYHINPGQPQAPNPQPFGNPNAQQGNSFNPRQRHAPNPQPFGNPNHQMCNSVNPQPRVAVNPRQCTILNHQLFDIHLKPQKGQQYDNGRTQQPQQQRPTVIPHLRQVHNSPVNTSAPSLSSPKGNPNPYRGFERGTQSAALFGKVIAPSRKEPKRFQLLCDPMDNCSYDPINDLPFGSTSPYMGWKPGMPVPEPPIGLSFSKQSEGTGNSAASRPNMSSVMTTTEIHKAVPTQRDKEQLIAQVRLQLVEDKMREEFQMREKVVRKLMKETKMTKKKKRRP